MKTIKEPPTISNEQLNTMSKEQLIILLRLQRDQLGEKDKYIANLTEQVNLLTQKRFGRSSEKNCEGQLSIFNEVEEAATPETAEESNEEIQTVTYSRKKAKKRKQMDLSKFPVVRIEHRLMEEESKCGRCGKDMKVVSTETVKRLRYVPARIEVEEHVTYVYACVDSACDFMKRADKDKPLLKGSLATGSIVAAIMNGKYTLGLPLYRIEDEFKRNGIEIDRKRMSHWIIRCAEEYLSLVYNALKNRLLACQYKQADETTVQVLNEPGRKATTKSYMWVYLTGELCGTPPIILYQYEETRAGYHPKEFLGANRSYLTTDGYQAYHGLPFEIQVTLTSST